VDVNFQIAASGVPFQAAWTRRMSTRPLCPGRWSG